MERPPRIGIVLTAGYEAGSPISEYDFYPPEDQGKYRLEAGAMLLLNNGIDLLYPLGGMEDPNGYPVEIGHLDYLSQILSRSLPGGDRLLKLRLFDLAPDRCETIADLRGALTNLKAKNWDQDVTVISHAYHLFPRVEILKHLEGFPQVKLVPAELIHAKFGALSQDLLRTLTPPSVNWRHVLKSEIPLNHLLMVDLVLGTDWARNLIQQKAKQSRTQPTQSA